jgi:hypothetical protein
MSSVFDRFQSLGGEEEDLFIAGSRSEPAKGVRAGVPPAVTGQNRSERMPSITVCPTHGREG